MTARTAALLALLAAEIAATTAYITTHSAHPTFPATAGLAALIFVTVAGLQGRRAPTLPGGPADPARPPATTAETALRIAVALAHTSLQPDPQPGDLVVETSSLRRRYDPDAIGWLVAHGPAPYNEDGTGPTREVHDVTPLTGTPGTNGRPYQRWENATFLKIPDQTVERLELTPPDGWHSDFA